MKKLFNTIFLLCVLSTVCFAHNPRFGNSEYTNDEIDAFLASINYAFVTSNDVLTDVTGTELETLTAGSDADALHTHTAGSITGFLIDAGVVVDNSIPAFDGVDGVTTQPTLVTIDDGDNVKVPGTLTAHDGHFGSPTSSQGYLSLHGKNVGGNKRGGNIAWYHANALDGFETLRGHTFLNINQCIVFSDTDQDVSEEGNACINLATGAAKFVAGAIELTTAGDIELLTAANIGTTNNATLTVFNDTNFEILSPNVTNPQFFIAYDASNKATFHTDSGGILTITASGDLIDFDNENLITTGTFASDALTITSDSSSALKVVRKSDAKTLIDIEADGFPVFNFFPSIYRIFQQAAGNGVEIYGFGAQSGELISLNITGSGTAQITATQAAIYSAVGSTFFRSGVASTIFFADNVATEVEFSKGGGSVTLLTDTAKLKFGLGRDLEIFHDGTDSFINNLTGDLHITPVASVKIGDGATNFLEVSATGLQTFNGAAAINGLTLNTATDKTNDYQALSTDDYISIDASSNTVTVTLDASPATGDTIRIACSDDTFTADIDLNGETFYGDASNIEIFELEILILHYDGTEWRLG